MAAPTSRPQGTPVAVGVGIALAALAVVVLALGGVLVGAHATQRDDEGYYHSGRHHLATATRALVSDDLHVHANGPGWLVKDGHFGSLRITASGSAARPVFVGIARTSQVNGYLRGVSREQITDFELDPFSIESTSRLGSAAPAPPGGKQFWAVSATGAGEQTIKWQLAKGDWSVVVMNADGSPGVATNVSVGGKLELILWLGVGILAVGGLMLAAGIVAIVLGRRRPAAARAELAGRIVEGVA
jgi:hypothetical protein